MGSKHSVCRTMFDLPQEIIYVIFEFTNPCGKWKYSCRDALDVAIKNMIKKRMYGDDPYTSKIVTNEIINVDTGIDEPSMKYYLYGATTDFQWTHIGERLIDIGYDGRLLYSYKSLCRPIKNLTDHQTFIIMKVGGVSHIPPRSVKKFIMDKFVKTVSYVLFETDFGGKWPGYSDILLSVFRECDLSPRQIYLAACRSGTSVVIKEMILNYHDEILQDDDDWGLIDTFINYGRDYRKNYDHVPLNANILSTLFKGLGKEKSKLRLKKWGRQDILCLLWDNREQFPEWVGQHG